MGNLYPIKAGFVGGVISPSSTGRVDSETYDKGLSLCQNFMITPAGSLRLRRGFEFNAGLLSDNIVDNRIITFPRPIASDYVVQIDGVSLNVRDRFGIVKGAGLFINDPFFSSGDRFWKKGGSGYLPVWRFEPGLRTFLKVYSGGGSGEVYIQQRVFAPADTYTLNFSYGSEGGTEISGAVFDKTPVRVRIGTTPTNANIFDQTFDGGSWSNPKDISINFTTTTTSYYISIGLAPYAGPGGWNRGAIYAPVTLAGSNAVPVSFSSPWSGSQIANLQYAYDVSVGEMYFVHPEVAPYLLKYDHVTRAWTFGVVAFTGAPSSWTGSNWPSVVEIYQSRLWLAATPSDANTIWASKVGAYNNFTVGANPDDALEIELASAGGVLWMRGLDNLLIGTENGELLMGGHNGPITSADFFLYRQNGYGSSRIQPLMMGRQVGYVGSGTKRVRVTQQSEEARGMTGVDISVYVNALLESNIKEMHYQADPDYQLITVLQNGRLALSTYDAQNNLLAWYEYITPNGTQYAGEGEIYSACVTQEYSGQALWVVVRRDSNFTLEIMEPEFLTRSFMDSYAVEEVEVISQRLGAYNTAFSSAFSGGYVDSETTKGVISGIGHLEGMTVGVVYSNANTDDGQISYEVLPDQIVQDGVIFVPNTVSNGSCTVGIKYLGKAVTLPQDGGNPAGTAQGTKRKWNRIFSRLAFSAIPTLNGYRPVPEDKDIPISGNPLDASVTGDYEIRNEGFDEGVVIIEQDLPLRTEVAGLFGKSQANAT